jgi:DNA polymerase III delta prime subunit
MSELQKKVFLEKYQPLYFKDFDEENEVAKILQTLIKMDNLNILLIGDISSGKTTMLKSLIREYYKDYSPKDYKDNVLYINSLKEQGINYYRSDVKTFCQTCSIIKNKKKIVVLDDIDLINEQSQHVFRNCIDKFSYNVHFISSCVNIQKVIETIQSRFTIIKINPLFTQNIIKIIEKIKINENITIDKDAQEFVINISNKSIKLIINYMEKFKLIEEKITLNIASQMCTNISFVTFDYYTKCIKTNNYQDAITVVYEIYDSGYSVMDILDNYFLYIKNTYCLSEDEKYKIIPIICKYISIFHTVHEDEIELALFTNNLIKTIHV